MGKTGKKRGRSIIRKMLKNGQEEKKRRKRLRQIREERKDGKKRKEIGGNVQGKY